MYGLNAGLDQGRCAATHSLSPVLSESAHHSGEPVGHGNDSFDLRILHRGESAFETHALDLRMPFVPWFGPL